VDPSSVTDQLDDLKLCLEVDNDMFKIAVGTLLYCCAAVRLLKKKNRGCCASYHGIR
jgi:hypothetical protein